MKRLVGLGVALVFVPVVFAGSVSAGGDTLCSSFPEVANPEAPGGLVRLVDGVTIDGDLVVEQNIVCELRGSTVNGNAIVEDGSGEEEEFTGLGMFDGTTINGNVEIGAFAEAFLEAGSTVDGNMEAGDGAFFVGVFDGSTVTGNVEVGADAVGAVGGGTVEGNYECDHCVFEDAFFATIEGNLSISGEQDGSFIVGSKIFGNLEVTDSASVEFPLLITSGGAFFGGDPIEAPTVVHGDVVYKGNQGPIVLQFSEVRGNVEIAENDFTTQIPNPESGPELLPAVIRGNTIDGDVTFEKNKKGSSFIADNTIGGKLECKNNRPRPAGFGNIADEKVGQCRSL